MSADKYLSIFSLLMEGYCLHIDVFLVLFLLLFSVLVDPFVII